MKKLRELDLKKLSGNKTRGDELSALTNRLKKGDFAFDSYGKPLLIKRKNVNNLPDMHPQPNVKIRATQKD